MQQLDGKHCLSFPGIQGLFGYVTINGQPLEVYGIKMEGSKAVGYIEAKEGSQFDVRILDQRGPWPAPPVDHTIHLAIDGSGMDGIVQQSNHPKFRLPVHAASRHYIFEGRQESPNVLRPFFFAKLATTDDDRAACQSEVVIKNMITIQIKYWRVQGIHRKDMLNPMEYDEKPVHERSKVATLSHRAAYGAPVAQRPTNRYTCDFLDPFESPLSTVEFRYRSRQLLQLEGYIPDSAPPSPRSPCPSLDLDDDDLEAELESLKRQERIAQLEREKRRRSGGGSSGGGGVSSSAAGKKRAKPNIESANGKLLKKVKKEEGERREKLKQPALKGKKKKATIDLCDSESE